LLEERRPSSFQPARAATGESASYIEVVGGRMDLPAGLAMAHQRLDAMYAND
jgi:indolepyruvate decarboxylase